MTGAPGRYRDVLALFDWNGTIVMDRDRAHSALNEVLRVRGRPAVASDDFATTFRLPFAAMFGDLGIPPHEAPRAEAEWNDRVLGADAPARRGAGEALRALAERGAVLGIVSAAGAAAVGADADRLGLATWFATIDAAVTDKEQVLRRRRGSAGFACYVGDTVYDIRSAVQAGYFAVGVSSGYAAVDDLREAGAGAVIGDLRELLEVIAQARRRGAGRDDGPGHPRVRRAPDGR